MEEDSLPPTPVVPATSPLGGVLEKHANQVPVSTFTTIIIADPPQPLLILLFVLKMTLLYESLYSD